MVEDFPEIVLLKPVILGVDVEKLISVVQNVAVLLIEVGPKASLLRLYPISY
ncbi:MAG: hypothetical protein GXO67_02735 [Archaeoglobi archaeon]|nr:hypothetical protein [Archaeoglobi archaeon]